MTPAESRTVSPVLLVAFATIGCDTKTVEPEHGPLTLVVSGDTAGWIVPCGCSSNQSGGLLRRGTFLASLRSEQSVVFADIGGAAAGVSEYDRAKFEAILRGELAMQIVAHNIGDSEARLGADYLRRIQSELNVPFVSCNVRDREGQLIAEPVRMVTAAGRRIALLGVLSAELPIEGMEIEPPREAILSRIRQTDEAFDSLIVLAYVPAKELEELASSLPEADIVVGGPTGQSIAPRRIGPTLWASATNKGKFLAQFTLEAKSGWQGLVIEMNNHFADDGRQRDNLAAFYAALAEHDFRPRQTTFVQTLPVNIPKDYLIAGTARCRACHTGDCRQWDESGHARAWQSLRDTGAHVDSYCQQCHTTGYGLPGGFASARTSQELVNVGCESCHGPSHAHAAKPHVHTAFFRQAKDRCDRCHDRENSPDFAFDDYWSQIEHGDMPADRSSAGDFTKKDGT